MLPIPPPVAVMTVPTPSTVSSDLSPLAIKVQSTIERMLPFAQGDNGDIYLLPTNETLTEPMLRLGLAELTEAGYLRHSLLAGGAALAVLA